MSSTRTGSTEAAAGCVLKLCLGLAPLALLFGVAVATRLYGLGFGPRHHVGEPVAQLGPNVLSAISEARVDVGDRADAEDAALRISASLLHFGFRHRTDLRFDRPRQGNGTEYAALFGVVFNELAKTAKLTAHARVVRSEPTWFMGFVPSHPAFRDHDWVVISDGDDTRYVDPTLHDAWLGADISRNVQGSLEAPRRGAVSRRAAQRPERLQSNLPAADKPRGVISVLHRLGVSLPRFSAEPPPTSTATTH